MLSGKRCWMCICDCGCIKKIAQGHLRNGHTKSCGCLRTETTIKRNFKHGMTRKSIYRSWQEMTGRCLKPTHPAFKDYGGRGITICSNWIGNFEAFWRDMGNKPHGTSLDRIDNNGPYCPTNCRWASAKQQANNRRSNAVYVFNGVAHTISEWADIHGIDQCRLRRRLCELSWPIERALLEPIGAYRNL